jgi:hypothetical protein
LTGDAANDLDPLDVANESFEWYKSHAIRTRRADRISELAILACSTSIPVATSLLHHSSGFSAIAGGAVALLTGCRSAFKWHDNYLRFSRAREAIEGERRQFRTRSVPYDDVVERGRLLVAAVTRIERNEMYSWLRIQDGRNRA